MKQEAKTLFMRMNYPEGTFHSNPLLDGSKKSEYSVEFKGGKWKSYKIRNKRYNIQYRVVQRGQAVNFCVKRISVQAKNHYKQ